MLILKMVEFKYENYRYVVCPFTLFVSLTSFKILRLITVSAMQAKILHAFNQITRFALRFGFFKRSLFLIMVILHVVDGRKTVSDTTPNILAKFHFFKRSLVNRC